jgi:hypothetical protein
MRTEGGVPLVGLLSPDRYRTRGATAVPAIRPPCRGGGCSVPQPAATSKIATVRGSRRFQTSAKGGGCWDWIGLRGNASVGRDRGATTWAEALHEARACAGFVRAACHVALPAARQDATSNAGRYAPPIRRSALCCTPPRWPGRTPHYGGWPGSRCQESCFAPERFPIRRRTQEWI